MHPTKSHPLIYLKREVDKSECPHYDEDQRSENSENGTVCDALPNRKEQSVHETHGCSYLLLLIQNGNSTQYFNHGIEEHL